MKIEFNPDGSIKLPEALVEKREYQESVEERNNILSAYWDEQTLSVCQFFEEMTYLGSIQSKRNRYYAFHHEKYYLVSAKVSPLVRFNFISDNELGEIAQLLNQFLKKGFIIQQVVDSIKNSPLSNKRLELYRTHEVKEQNVSDLYSVLLLACYVLCVQGKLLLNKVGRNVVFIENPKGLMQGEVKPNIF